MICAFANDFPSLGGGYILIGVAENQGQPNPNRINLESANGHQNGHQTD
jgi:predicted HTH transcriptional regulator